MRASLKEDPMTIKPKTKWPSAPQRGRTKCPYSGHLFSMLNYEDIRELKRSFNLLCSRGRNGFKNVMRSSGLYGSSSSMSTKELLDLITPRSEAYFLFNQEMVRIFAHLPSRFHKVKKDLAVYMGMYHFPKKYKDFEYYNDLEQVRDDLKLLYRKTLPDLIKLVSSTNAHLSTFLARYEDPSKQAKYPTGLTPIDFLSLIHKGEKLKTENLEFTIIYRNSFYNNLLRSEREKVVLDDVLLLHAKVWNRFFLALGYPKPDDIIL